MALSYRVGPHIDLHDGRKTVNTSLTPQTDARNAPLRVPVYEALAKDIQNLGIEAVFGLLSDDTAMFATALDSIGIRFYGARHENNAITMAEGYASVMRRRNRYRAKPFERTHSDVRLT